MSLLGDIITASIKNIRFNPVFLESNYYKVWISMLSPTTCKECFYLHGKIYLPKDAPPKFPDSHDNCACIVEWLKSVKKGTASFEGDNGIEVLLSRGESLPNQYLTKKLQKSSAGNRSGSIYGMLLTLAL